MSIAIKISFILAAMAVVIFYAVEAQKPLPCSGHEVGMPRRDLCVTRCPGPCGGNGTCNAANECVCKPGYVASAKNLICTPICLAGCAEAGGFCDAVGTCSCPIKTEVFNTRTRCCEKRFNDVCRGKCLLGKCRPNATCTCPTGYQNKGNVTTNDCEPICPTLPNSACVLPGLNSCNRGYTFNTVGNCASS